MQKQNDLAVNLMNLFNEGSYKQFQKGFFLNQPKLEGAYYIFKKITDPKFCIIVNTSGNIYPSNMFKTEDYVFIIFNVDSFEDYINNFVNKYFPTLINIVDQNLQKENTRNLPYGYYLDENGDLKIDFRKAEEVRKIYDMYIETRSVRHVAAEMQTNFSDIREILHDNEQYEQMQKKIIPLSKIRKVREILAQNIRGGAQKKITLEDELKMAKQKNKQLNKQQIF